MSTVLVTGGSGFIGSYCIMQLLEAGHTVKTTVRNLAREPEVRGMLEGGGAKHLDKLSFSAADLTADDGWAQAVKGCDYVLHVASPFPMGEPADENDLIVPAREGALRVLRAARDAGVKRVVLTSSFAAVGYGRSSGDQIADETFWTDPATPGISAYVKSKTVAEKAAWEFIEKEGGKLELSVVNPVGVLGPVLGSDFSTSILLVERLLSGAIPMAPRAYFGLVDVRDVADLHIRAMTDPKAKGERFLATNGASVSILEIAKVLKANLGAAAGKVPTSQAPDWMIRLFALASPTARAVASQLGRKMDATNAKAREKLGWTPRSDEEAIMATANSLLAHNVVPATA